MSKPNNEADIKNGNWGTPGTNKTWDEAQGNKGKQLNPTWTPPPPDSSNGDEGGGAKEGK